MAKSHLFRKNREKLKKLLPPSSAVILHSGDQMPRNGDQYFPFRQSSHFYYLTGIRQEKSILLMCPDHPDHSMHEMLFILSHSRETEIWEGNKLDKEEASRISGIGSIYPLEQFEKKLHELMLRSERVFLNAEGSVNRPEEVPGRDARMLVKLREKYPCHKMDRLGPLLSKLRMVKEVEEIEWIRQACAITASAFRQLLGVVNPGIFEYELEAEMIREFIRLGADGHAFSPIIASGPNACILHYSANRGVCRDGDLLLLDFGAEVQLYASDCSRTIPVNGGFTNRQMELYQSVWNVYREAESLLVPGKTLDAFNREVNHLWEEEHLRLGLYTKTELKKQSPANPLRMKYYPHGTSHFLGLDVHDTGDKFALLQPGMVLTCEPGIYIREEGIGIRLENDLLLTPDGNENLMKGIPMDPEEISEMMKQK